MQSVGYLIEKARVNFEKTKSRMTTGKGNLVSQISKLRELGAKTKKQIPVEYADDLLGFNNPSESED